MTPRFFLQSLILAAANLLLGAAHAQDDFPRKPIRWIVGYPAGASSDFVARTVATSLSAQLGQQVIVENKPGSSGSIAADSAARAPADGYTIVTVDNGILIYNPALYEKIPYEPVKDFAPIGLMVRMPILLLANNEAPLRSMKDFADAARKNPGKVSYGSPGIGTPHNMAMEMFKNHNKLFAVPIQYRGGAPMLTDIMGGHIQYMVLDVASTMSSLKANKLRPLGVFSRARLASLPDVPTTFELGLGDVEAIAWQGIAVPSATPESVRRRLSTELAKAIASPEVRAKFIEFGLEATPSSAAEMKALWDSDQKYWSQLIKDRKIKAE
jgi:tripartite-type tricarboxylate transporter receptor subunit TctC